MIDNDRHVLVSFLVTCLVDANTHKVIAPRERIPLKLFINGRDTSADSRTADTHSWIFNIEHDAF